MRRADRKEGRRTRGEEGEAVERRSQREEKDEKSSWRGRWKGGGEDIDYEGDGVEKINTG